MRDKKNGNTLSLSRIRLLHSISFSSKLAIEDSENIMRIFDNVREEFEVELTQANQELFNAFKNLD